MLAVASLLVGAFLATPYAIFLYDMPMLTNGVLAVLRDEEQINRVITIPELIVLASTLVLPVIMLITWRPATLRSIPLILLFGIVVRRALQSRSRIPTSPQLFRPPVAPLGVWYSNAVVVTVRNAPRRPRLQATLSERGCKFVAAPLWRRVCCR